MLDPVQAKAERPGGSPPLQARAHFLEGRTWEIVVGLNRAACDRDRSPHGFNPETHLSVERVWRERQDALQSLDDAIEFLRWCHYRMPFLLRNGDTFADLGRQIVAALFAGLPMGRRRAAAAAAGQYIAGELDRELLAEIVEGLWEAVEFRPGDRVKSLRGSLTGLVLELHQDGRVVWRPDGTNSDLISLPESLLRVQS